MKVLFVTHHELVRRYKHVEGGVAVVRNLLAVPKLAQHRAILDIAPIRQRLERWHKLGDLLLPVVQRRSWCNNKKGAPNVVHLGQVRHKRNTLDGFSQTHLVRQNTVDALLIQIRQPGQTLDLVWLQCA